MGIQSLTLYLESLEALAKVRETMNLNNSAASAMEEAARVCQNAAEQEITHFESNIAQYLARGAYFYRLNNQYDLASSLLIKSAKNTKDIDAALAHLDLALEIQEEEGRFRTSAQFYDAAVKFACEQRRFADCAKFLDRQNAMMAKDAEKFAKRIWRNICSKMVLSLHLKDVKAAQRAYLQGVTEFGGERKCDEHALCEQFLEVFTAADEEALQNMIEHAQLGVFLIASVSRLARKLNMKDIEPTLVIAEAAEEEEKKEMEQQKEENKKKAKGEVTDEQLKSEMDNIQLDDEGAPNLLDG